MNRLSLFILMGFITLSLLLYFNFLKHEPPRLTLYKTSFYHLKQWTKDNHHAALIAFKNSCSEILRRPPEAPFNAIPESGKVSDWQKICLAAEKVDSTNPASAQHFFERWFDPYEVLDRTTAQGFFTGYYLPLLQASLTPTNDFRFPIFGIPNDLIKVNIDLFRPDIVGKPLIGYLLQNRLIPYYDRAAISSGILTDKAPILAWGNDEIDIFFAQIQGSAVLSLPDQRKIVIGYAGDNGRPYLAIGRVLLQRKELDKKNISMQSIRAWLQTHPRERDQVLNANPSYVFFQYLKDKNPLGSEHVPLTPMRSLAVDPQYIPLGIPVWLDTAIPDFISKKSIPFQHLLMAQDTGGAIKGVIRGDIYCGEGNEAAYVAGNMQNKGKYWLLFPKHPT